MVTAENPELPVQVNVRSCERLILAGMFVGTTGSGNVNDQVNAPTPAPPAPFVTEKGPGSIYTAGSVESVASKRPVASAEIVLEPPVELSINWLPESRKFSTTGSSGFNELAKVS